MKQITTYLQKNNTLSGTLSVSTTNTYTITHNPTLSGIISKSIDSQPNLNFYNGSYIFTPNKENQTIETNNKFLTENIIINSIPSNYGLISWDGSILTVS